MGTRITPERLLGEVEDVLRTIPAYAEFHRASSEALAWSGRAAAVVGQWDPVLVPRFDAWLAGLHAPLNATSWTAVLRTLHRARHDLLMVTARPTSIAVEGGRVFDYFDEVRKAIELAHEDVLFVDPYLDADFVSRYLPHVADGVVIRLLCGDKKLKTLLPAVDSFVAQRGQPVLVRVTPTVHDRYVFVDGASCYQSGASFKDGAKTAPTTLTQITDAFEAVRDTYERFWAAARVERG